MSTDVSTRESRTGELKSAILRLPILQIAALLALVVWAVVRIPSITAPPAVLSILVLAALLGIASLGQTLVVILGGLDLAVPGYIAVGAFVAANLAGAAGWPLPLAIALAIAVCGGMGAFVGFICHRLKINTLVVTLGAGAVLTGGVLFVSGGQFISAPPPEVRQLVGVMSTTFGLPVPPVIVIWIAIAVIMAVFLSRTAAGRRLYATGANPRAATLARVKTGRVWVCVFAFSGIIGALAGVLIAGFSNGTTSIIGDPYLFTGLAAVVVGGTTFGSIRGDYTRTVLGALILTILTTVLIGEGIREGQSRILYGLIILAVVAIYGRERRLRDRF